MYNLLHGAALVIGCSERVTQNMRIMGGVTASTLYECIDFNQIRMNGGDRGLVRKKLGIPDDAFVWGMAGGGYYRKGADIIPAVLKKLSERNIYFIWIGDLTDSGYSHYVRSLCNAEGLSNFIVTGSQTTDYYKYMDVLDGFLLTSREDPFPLVMIEAAALGKPIVSFASGGVEEFMKPGMGFVIETYNPFDMSVAMKRVMDESDCINRETLISRAAEFDAVRMASLWTELLMQV
jgi:glycosyltransferase involved in cell wall biosynthesis